MRKIEKQMCDAIQSNIDWKSKNTSVHFDPETGVSIVRLHGNKIAEVSDNDMTIFDGGWQTTTTKSRLNALCDYFCIAGEGVFQKDFTWYVRKFVGKINGQDVFKTDAFDNGYIFAWRNHRGVTNTFPSIITSPILLSFHMKFLLVIVIGVLLWNNNDARKVTADALQNMSDFIEPSNTKPQTIGEKIDSFLD